MKRLTIFATLAALALAGAALAQTASSTQTSGQASGSAMTSGGTAAVSTEASTDAEARAAFQRTEQEVQDKGAKLSAATRAKAETRIDASAKSTDDAAAKGMDKVAGRLATEFGVTAEAIEAEHTRLDVSMGQLMIAHTLLANAKGNLTVDQLFQMRKDGMGWGQIAAGMGLQLGEVVSAVRAENRVANGEARADGKVAAIHGDGARAGLGLNSGLGVGNKGVGAGVGAGVHIKVGH